MVEKTDSSDTIKTSPTIRRRSRIIGDFCKSFMKLMRMCKNKKKSSPD